MGDLQQARARTSAIIHLSEAHYVTADGNGTHALPPVRDLCRRPEAHQHETRSVSMVASSHLRHVLACSMTHTVLSVTLHLHARTGRLFHETCGHVLTGRAGLV